MVYVEPCITQFELKELKTVDLRVTARTLKQFAEGFG
ncbi:hypothetical protein TFUB4_01355 [Tannerella forsythia]|nr:hypothetical protein TFUB4_01355 [Tannerella forsythia]